MHLRFNRHATKHCADPLAKYPASKYNVFLYNNPVRNLDTIDYDQSIKIATGLDASSGVIDVKIPANIPKVKNGDVWYLRVDTSLDTAPQVWILSLLKILKNLRVSCFFFLDNADSRRCLPSTTLLVLSASVLRP